MQKTVTRREGWKDTQTLEKYRRPPRHSPKPASLPQPTTGLPDVPLAGSDWPVELLLLLGCESHPSGAVLGKPRNLGLGFRAVAIPSRFKPGKEIASSVLYIFSFVYAYC